MWSFFFKFVAGPVIAIIVGRGVLAALHEFGLYPDQYLAGLIVNSPELFRGEIAWIVAALMTGGLPIAWNYFHFGRYLRKVGVHPPAQRYPLANLDEWRGTDPLQLWQAGCLWGGIKPIYPVNFDNPAYAAFSMLLAAAEHGELELKKREPDQNFASSHVTRQDLAKFGARKGEIPEFLKNGGDLNAVEPVPICRDVWLLDAIHYVAFKSWEVVEWNNLGEKLRILGAAEEDVRQRARDGDLPIWGREGFSGTLNPIPPEYWEYYGLEWGSLLKGEAEEFQTELTKHARSVGIRRSLMTSKSKVEELWPVEDSAVNPPPTSVNRPTNRCKIRDCRFSDWRFHASLRHSCNELRS